MVAIRRSSLATQQIVDAIGGDRGAQEAVIVEWLPTVYGWCGRLGAGRIDSEEAAHDVMMTFLRRHHTIGGPEQLASWLFAVSRRVVANHRNRAWIRRWLPGATLDTQIAPDRADALTDHLDRARSVERALAGLSVPHREVLVLCYLEERSIEEVSVLTGVKPGTIKSRLFHARQKFQILYERQGR